MKKVILKLTGGLGNQLFIYALYLYLKKKSDIQIVTDSSEYRNKFRTEKLKHFGIEYKEINQLEKFISKPSVLKIITKIFRTFLLVRKNESDIDILTFEFPAKFNLFYFNGYWQNKNIINEVITDLKSNIKLKEEYKTAEFRDLKERIKNSLSVSIHIRRSDYLSSINSSTFEILSIDYYKLAINQFRNGKCTFYIFSDDLAWCDENLKELLNDFEHHFIKIGADILEFELMRNCKNNIVANSTFSLWAAILNFNNDRKVIAPRKYYIDKDLQKQYEENLIFNDFTYI